MKESILIIGGTGFIGHQLCKRIKELNFKISVISKHHINEQLKISDIEYFCLDISIKDDLECFFQKKQFSYVVNLSGYIDHSLFSKNGSQTINDHFNGVVNLVSCVKQNSLKRIIQIGSSDEYGDSKSPQDENMRESPISPYSFAKTASTHFLQMMHKTENLPVIIIRLFLVYGPGQANDRFLPFVIKQCLLGNSFPVSKGDQIRDFCYVSDIIDGIIKSLFKDSANGEIINLASGTPVKIKTVMNIIQNKIGAGIPRFGEINYRKGENMSLFANIEKAKSFLNWQPKVDLKTGIFKTISSFKDLKL